ncbi:MAG: sensor histidine kinase [Faecousia sp.]
MNQSLKIKIVIFVYSIVIVLFLVLSFFLLSMMERVSHQQLIEEHSTLLNVANLTINSRQQYMIGVADYYARSPEIQDILQISNSGRPITTIPDESRFKTPSIIILSTVFYNSKGNAIHYTAKDSSRTPIDQCEGESFLKLASGRATYVWEFIDRYSDDFMQLDHSPKLCLWRAIRDNNDVHMVGAVAVTIDARSLLGFDATAQKLAENLVIISSENQLVYNRSSIALDDDDLSLLGSNSFETNAGYYPAQLSSGKYMVSYQALPSTDFVSLFLYPYSDFSFGIDVFYIYVLVGLLLYILFLFPSIILASRFITKPLEILTKSIQQFAEGDRSAKVQFKYDDEIGKLGKAFNAMVLDNERLRISEYELRLKNKDAELALMQTQINPHFLYNMLNAIQWQALKSGNKEIADISYSMAQVFRISLNRGKGIISVKQEKDLVSYYLSLQKYRLGKKINYHIDFQEDTLDCQIPKLILQPLAENAIVHGMAKDSSLNLEITISASLSEDKQHLHFMVQDNGCGIPAEILQYLPSHVIPSTVEGDQKGNKSNRFAIKNIYDRLQLIYGNDFTFCIQGDCGTTIEIILPAAETEERRELHA